MARFNRSLVILCRWFVGSMDRSMDCLFVCSMDCWFCLSVVSWNKLKYNVYRGFVFSLPYLLVLEVIRCRPDFNNRQTDLLNCCWVRGVLLGILGRGMPPDSPNPNPISDQNMPFFTPVFRPNFPTGSCQVPSAKNWSNSELKRYIGYLSHFFIADLELKRQKRLYALVVPLKTISDFRSKRLKNHTRHIPI